VGTSQNWSKNNADCITDFTRRALFSEIFKANKNAPRFWQIQYKFTNLRDGVFKERIRQLEALNFFYDWAYWVELKSRVWPLQLSNAVPVAILYSWRRERTKSQLISSIVRVLLQETCTDVVSRLSRDISTAAFQGWKTNRSESPTRGGFWVWG